MGLENIGELAPQRPRTEAASLEQGDFIEEYGFALRSKGPAARGGKLELILNDGTEKGFRVEVDRDEEFTVR